MILEAYRNTKQNTWSLIKPHGLVFAHADRVCLQGATFRISKSRQRKQRETGRPCVHAYVRGYSVVGPTSVPEHFVEAHYDPNEADTFLVGNTPVSKARSAILTEDGRIFVEGAA